MPFANSNVKAYCSAFKYGCLCGAELLAIQWQPIKPSKCHSKSKSSHLFWIVWKIRFRINTAEKCLNFDDQWFESGWMDYQPEWSDGFSQYTGCLSLPIEPPESYLSLRNTWHHLPQIYRWSNSSIFSEPMELWLSGHMTWCLEPTKRSLYSQGHAVPLAFTVGLEPHGQCVLYNSESWLSR